MSASWAGAAKVIRELATALNKLARPYLTALIATLFNVLCAWAVVRGKLEVKEYIMAVGPTNAMIIGFWFGERTALKRAGKPDEEA